MDLIDVDMVVKFIRGLQQPNGSFTGDQWGELPLCPFNYSIITLSLTGEVDTRFSFCAIATLALLV